MTTAYQRLLAIAKSKGYYKKGIPRRPEIKPNDKLKFYRRRLAQVQTSLAEYRQRKLTFRGNHRVGTLKMFEDELKRKIEQWTTTKQ